MGHQVLVAAYALVLATMGVVLVAHAWSTAAWISHLPLAWWGVTLAFVAAETVGVDIEVRRERHTLSLSGIALLLGVLSVDPVTLVVCRLVGGGAALAAARGVRGLKLCWNLALYGAETGLAATIAALTLGGGDPPSALGSWLVLLAAVLLAELLGLVAVPLVIVVSGGGLQPSLLSQIARSHLLATASAMFGVVAAAAMLESTGLVLLAAVPVVAVAVLMRVHGRLGKEHHDLQQLHDFTIALSERGSLDTALGLLTTILRSEVAAVATGRPDGSYDARIVRAGVMSTIVIDPGDPRFEPGEDPEDVEIVIAGEAQGPGGAIARALGAGSALARSIGGDSTGPVWVVVGDRIGPTDAYPPDEVRLFASMAATLGTRLSADRLLQRLEYEARVDPLTELANRLTLEAELDTRLGRSRSGAVLLLDLDRFKDVNDSLGHNFGDHLLRTFGARLENEIRDGDVAGRLGGDEFAVIIDDVGSDEALDTILRSLADRLNEPLDLEGITLELGASIGVARWPEDARSAGDLLRLADIAMYEAKRTHQQWVRYHTTIDHGNAGRLSLVGQVRDAMADRDLTVYLQPQVRAGDLALIGAEALLRWNHPEHGLIPPNEFLPLLEHSSLAGPLTSHVITESLRAQHRLDQAGIEVRISINLTARDVLDRMLPWTVDRAMVEAGVAASRVCFEVTESSLIVDIDTAIANLTSLRDLGCRVSIDDFGTGYASLRYLQRLPIDEVKIDRAFVGRMARDDGSAAIVRSTALLVRELGLELVAEGVEDVPTLRLIRETGFDIVQGYLVSPAVDIDRFILWARARAEAAAPMGS